MEALPWEFWIDVGGTFTDCVARDPKGTQQRFKILSSGITKGTVGADSGGVRVLDAARIGDPIDFWVDFSCRLLDRAGASVAETKVVSFDSKAGAIELAEPIAADSAINYELFCDLEAPVLAIRLLLGLPLCEQVPPVRLRLGTTRGTNALLTRTGAKSALLITKGFGDLLEIGSQERPRLFDLAVRKSSPLTERSVEINERVTADGEVLQTPEDEVLRAYLEKLKQQGIESLAICFLHADLYPEHEQRIKQLAKEVGFAEVSCSSDVAPLVKIVPRAETTVVDAYLNPVLRTYLADLQNSLPGSHIRFMTSAGGLVPADDFRGSQSVLSGPAGGVVGYARIAQAAGFSKAIGFDMGGTSTDVSRFDGHYAYEYESRKAGVRIMTPTLAIDTVAAGGGSICGFDGTNLVVGPESAGADPGPACYGRGGPLTVTDVNLLLGRIAVDHFPFQLNRRAAENRLAELATRVQSTTGEVLSEHELAEGLLHIANANMVRAIRSVSIAKGADPAEYVLVCFGGAGSQHACAIARELGIAQILIHPDAAILSAYGIGQADASRHAAMGVAKELNENTLRELPSLFDTLSTEPVQQLAEEGFVAEQIEVRQTVDVRYQGTDVPLNILYSPHVDLAESFAAEHRCNFGYVHQGRSLELVTARVEAIGKNPAPDEKTERCKLSFPKTPNRSTSVFQGKEVEADYWERTELDAGDAVPGPAIIADAHSTMVVEPGWQAEVLSGGEVLLVDQSDSQGQPTAIVESSPVMLEIFSNLFAGIAEQMGHVLRRTASSVNVKERLDFSCAIFSAEGELIANAPHVPVHLGAMGESVRATLAAYPDVSSGDVFVTNDPYRGGSHLPDVTVITPVFQSDSQELIFFTASRAHHAEIGGIRPGSMPPNSKRLGEEGVLISNFALVKNGNSHESELEALLSSGPYPSRNVAENLADIRAQVAANLHGAHDLLGLVASYGLPVVKENVESIQTAAESKVRAAVAKLHKTSCSFVDYLETSDSQSVPIQVAITFSQKLNSPAAIFDFTGSAPVVAGNLNANRAIVTAAVLYVLRLLVDEDIPLNEGVLRAVEIYLPECMLNPGPAADPIDSPAMAAGNVETSQRVVDVLLGALGIAGASQGTMNNLLFGNEKFGYYETICGGSGATAEQPGATAVQVHMTNTRATDPEVLERRHPIRLWQFAIRHGSGGKGAQSGGEGVIRTLEFLDSFKLSLISQRRGPHPPYGMAGGEPGAAGRNVYLPDGGDQVELPGICELDVEPGDRLIVKTPGGGGYGKLRESP